MSLQSQQGNSASGAGGANDTKGMYNTEKSENSEKVLSGSNSKSQEYEDDDLDEEEDIDELDLSNLETKVWLVKVPAFLSQHWNNIRQTGKEVGKVRIYDSADKNGNSISLILGDKDKEVEESGIPKQYNLKVVNSEVKNMFVFAEGKKDEKSSSQTKERGKHKSLPGSSRFSTGGSKLGIKSERLDEYNTSNGRGGRGLDDETFEDSENEQDGDSRSKLKPSSIESSNLKYPTFLSGTIHHECTVTPVLDSKYSEIVKNRSNLATKNIGKRTVQVLDDQYQSNLLNFKHPSLARLNKRTKFISGGSGAGAGAGGVGAGGSGGLGNRYERLPREKLVDLLFSAFEKYAYWSFKGLLEFTKQPSTYLKEVLGDIAILNKRGPYNSMYSLKPEYMSISGANAGGNGNANSTASTGPEGRSAGSSGFTAGALGTAGKSESSVGNGGGKSRDSFGEGNEDEDLEEEEEEEEEDLDDDFEDA
ncbi:Transcription initiation factor IIF subunit beta [Zancudomyces culisetae]|uniref:Transcription initiation factor IIF subunit beta n=1 Tax=Zancudomyces culisetae TaxID=1213189 RepID=A0A1R1PLX1_ZANCU|nr:Transcription initiation factor IIF subunit beta [Zancudomyces culisetae]|eukprot:OMH81933.1 Transcription initiation factor IIF subunit beta [Zancudomyces culisetae]